MFIFANLLYAIANILHIVLNIYFWIVIIKCLISWVNPDPYNQVVMILNRLTEPVLISIRRKLPFLMLSGLDLSPLILILGIQFAQSFFVQTLFDLSRHLR